MTTHPQTPEPTTNPAHPAPSPHSAPLKDARPRPWAIGAILLVFVLIVGVLIFTKLNPSGNNNPAPADERVQVKLLVDANCELCFKSNTILAKLSESGIKYDVQTYDIKSPEGMALADEFEVQYAPTALVNIKGLDQNSTIQAALQGQFVKGILPIKKGWVVVPEKFLDKQAHLLTFIHPPATCTVPKGKILITAQLDYGDCGPCAEAYNILQTVKDKYPTVQIDYSPILYNRSTPKSLLAAVNAGKGAVCSDRQGYLDPYSECNFSNVPFYGTPDVNEMRSCFIQSGGTSQATRDKFMTCLTDVNSGAEQELVANTLDMHKWNPLKYTPSFVIDCQYAFIGQKSIEAILCSLHPEFGCQLVPKDTNAGTTPAPTVIEGTPDANGNVYAEISSPDTNA